MTYLLKNNMRIFYRMDAAKKEGADTILMIHTNISDHTIFKYLVPFLNEHYNIVRYDLRGYGLSDLGSEEVSIELFADDLHYLINELNLRSIYVAAMGFGGLIALQYIRKYKHQIEKMILISMAAFPPESYEEVKQHRDINSNYGTTIPVKGILRKATCLMPGEEDYNWFYQLIDKTPVHLYKKIMDLTLYTDPLPYLKGCTVPSLILSGEKEVVFPQAYLEMNAIKLSNFSYSVIPNASSFMMLDQPNLTAAFIHEFFRSEKGILAGQDEWTTSIYKDVRAYTAGVLQGDKNGSNTDNHIEVDLLSSFKVRVNGKEMHHGWNRRYARELLILLLLLPSHSREQICEKLWPETPIPVAKKNLRVYLAHLKKLFTIDDKQLLVIEGENLYFDCLVRCDLLVLIQEISDARIETNEVLKKDLIVRIINKLPNADYMKVLYEDWFLQIRNQLDKDIANLVIWLGNKLVQEGNYQLAEQYLLQMIPILEENEYLYNLLIEIFEIKAEHRKMDYWLQQKEKVWGIE